MVKTSKQASRRRLRGTAIVLLLFQATSLKSCLWLPPPTLPRRDRPRKNEFRGGWRACRALSHQVQDATATGRAAKKTTVPVTSTEVDEFKKKKKTTKK